MTVGCLSIYLVFLNFFQKCFIVFSDECYRLLLYLFISILLFLINRIFINITNYCKYNCFILESFITSVKKYNWVFNWSCILYTFWTHLLDLIFLSGLLGFSIYRILWFTNRDTFTFPFLIWMLSFSCLIALTQSTMLNKGVKWVPLSCSWS